MVLASAIMVVCLNSGYIQVCIYFNYMYIVSFICMALI